MPDGTGFEIISLSALEESWEAGQEKHRSELYPFIFEKTQVNLKFNALMFPLNLAFDLRVTVDYPGDLVPSDFCTKISLKIIWMDI